MIGQPQVYETLERMGIPFDYYEHPEAPTIEIAAQFYRGEGTTLCKNLFFRNHKGNRHYLVIMDSRYPMDIHDMEHRLHQGKLSFASPERMMRHLGVRPGSVSLFTLVNDPNHEVTLFVDSNLMNATKVSFHPNDNRASLVISRDDMLRFIKEIGTPYEIVDLYDHTSQQNTTNNINMKEIIPIACDHAGYELKLKVIEHLRERGFEVKDCGTNSTESCDYPDYAHQVGAALNRGEFKRGIVICGSGNGVQMTVNKYPNVRCALCWTPEIAHLGRQHNDCNCISMPARFISEETAMQIVDEYLDTPFEGGRHQRRVEKISQLM